MARKYNEYYAYLENEIKAGRLSPKEASRFRLEYAKNLTKQEMKKSPSSKEIPLEVKRLMKSVEKMD